MKSLFKALCSLCILLTCASCEKWKNCAFDLLGYDGVKIEGGEHKRFGKEAQKHSFRLLNSCGKAYTYKDHAGFWGIWLPNQHHPITDKVDTLANGDLQISYDWATFKLTDNKSVIEVEVDENKTGQERVLYIRLSSLGRNLYNSLQLTITQSAE